MNGFLKEKKAKAKKSALPGACK
jgi:hypothetical protein